MAFNGIKYIKNVTKSFGYAMVDVVGEMNPVIHSFTETNADLGKELYTAVKDYKGTAKKIKKSVLDSDVYEFAKNYKRNLFDDLKTGKFYNKERIDEIATKASGWDDESLNSEFADMFDDDDDISFDDWDKDDLRSDMFMAEHIDEVGSKIANSNAEATIRSAEYTANVQKETTKALYMQNNKLFGQALQGMAAINANVGQLVGMPELMQVHANNASTFFEKTTGQLDQITSLLDTLVQNTMPSDEETRKRQEEGDDIKFRDIVTYKGAPNIKKYLQYAKKNLMNQSGELAMLGDLFGNGVSMLQTLAASPLEDLMKGAIKTMIPTVLKKSMDQFNDTLQGFFGSAITKLNSVDSYDNPVLGFIQKIFGITPDLKDGIDTSRYEKGKVNWDGASRKALVEVIPGQLAKIVSALTGEDPLIFNPENGRMESIGVINDRANSRLQDAANSAGSKVRKQIDDIMFNGKFRFSTRKEQMEWEEDLDSFFRSIFNNGGLTAKDLKDSNLNNLLEHGGGNTDLLKDILDRMSKDGKGRAALLDLNRRVLSGIDQYTAQMNELEAKGSADNALYSGMFDTFLRHYTSEEDKKNRSATGVEVITDDRQRSIFRNQVDEFGHNIFYYLQEIFKRQDAIYENSSYIVGHWTTGRGNGRGNSRVVTEVGRPASLKDIEYSRDITTMAKEVEDAERREDEWYESQLRKAIEEDSGIVTSTSKSGLNMFSLNNDVADYIAKLDEKNDNSKKTLVDKLLEETTLEGKFGTLVNGAKNFFNKPLEGIAKMFDSADERMYNLIYGEDPDKELKDMGFIGVIKMNIQESFHKMNGWIDEHILKPIKEKFGIENRDDFGRKLFGIFNKDYDEFKMKMKDGVFGKKENGVRSGGLLGDYIQDVKDNAKGAFNWAKDGVKDVFGKFSGSGEGMFDRWGKGSIATYATGGTVQKTGIAAVSKGELIIPSELNPYYHGPTNKAQQIRDENEAVRKYFGSFSKGSKKVKDTEEFDHVIEEVRNYIKNSGVEITDEELKKYLSQILIDERLQDYVDKNGNEISRMNERFRFFVNKAKSYIHKKAIIRARRKLTGQQIKIVDYDTKTGDYMTNDGYIGNEKKLRNGFKIVKNDKTNEYEMRKRPESFIGDMVLELAQAAKAVHKSLTDGSDNKEDKDTVFDEVIDDVTGNFKSYAGAMTVGGGIGAAVSALTGMVGGPLVGAAVGSAVGLTMKSDMVQKWLFGDVDDKGDRKGGVFSKEVSKFITEKVPSMAKFSMVGGAAGTILGHPMIGTLIGSAVGLAQKSETFGNFMFNGVDKNGNKVSRGLIDMTQDEFNKAIQKKLPKIGAGAIGGLLFGPFPSVTANLILGSAIGFASDTEKFKTKLFGAVGKDGERHGGVVGAFKEEIISPLADFIKDQTSGVKEWLENDIMNPLTNSVEPLAKQLGLFAKALIHPVKWLMNRGTKTNSWIQRMLEGKVFKAGRSIVSNVADAGINLAKGTIGAPFQLIGGIANHYRARQVAMGNADYMTSKERLDLRKQEHGGVGNIAKDFGNSKDTIVEGWGDLFTKGSRISGVGKIGAGLLKGIGSVGKMPGHLANAGVNDILNGGSVADDFASSGETISEGWSNLKTKGKRLSGIGKIGAGLLKGAGSVVKAPAYFGVSKFDGLGDFRRADEWMANATVDEKKQIRSMLIMAADSTKGVKERVKNLQRELDASVRSNTFNLLQNSDRETLVDKVKDKKSTLDDIEKFLKKAKTRKGDKLTDKQIEYVMSTIKDGVTELRRLQELKGNEELKAERDAAKAQLEQLDGGKYKWLAEAIGKNKNANKLISMLDYDISMDDQLNQQSDEEKAEAEKQEEKEKAEEIEQKHDDQHTESMNLGKVLINMIAATAGMKQPYPEVRTFDGADKAEEGSSDDINSDESKKNTTTADTNDDITKSSNPIAEKAKKLADDLSPKNLKEDTDNPESQDKFPAASIGGFVKKAGKAVLSAGEFVANKANSSGLFQKIKQKVSDLTGGAFGSGEDEQPEQEQITIAPGFKGKSNVQQPSSPVAGMFDDDSTAAHVGNYLPGQIVWIADRRYKYDGESQELVPDNDTAKQYEARKKKAMSDTGSGESKSTKPDVQQVKEANDDTKTLGSLFKSMGLGGGLLNGLTKLKNLSWIPTLAGPLALVSLLTGKLDQPISALFTGVAKMLGLGSDTTNNLTADGKDGEESYSGNIIEQGVKNIARGGKGWTFGKLFKSVGEFTTKKASDLKGLKKLSGKGMGKATSLVGKALSSIENGILGAENKINKDITNRLITSDAGRKVMEKLGYEVVEEGSQDVIKKTGSNFIKSGLDDAAKIIKDKLKGSTKISKVMDAADNVLKITDDALAAFKGKIKEWWKKLAKVLPDVLRDKSDDIAEGLAKTVTENADDVLKNSSKATAKSGTEAIPVVGWAVTIGFAIADYIEGYNNSSTVLGVEDPSEVMKVVAGATNSLKGILGGVASATGVGLAIGIVISAIPTKAYVTFFCDTIGKLMNLDINKQRQEYANKIDSYNQKYGTNYDTEKYEKNVKGKRSLFEEIKLSWKEVYNGTSVRNSGLDKDGNLIADYLDESTTRWKKYYSPLIQKGLDRKYAEVLYMNECLHDSWLALTPERIEDYKRRIDEYKSTAGAKEVPTITNDLGGLIDYGRVQSKANFLQKAAAATGIFKKTAAQNNVDYGNGISSDKYVGNYAEGGEIPESGVAALSKGELRTTPSRLASILSKAFDKKDQLPLGDDKDYKDLTDLGSFIKDIQSLDPDKTEWKDYWSNIDNKVKGKGILGTLKKTLYRIAATMFMPSFAMGKMLDVVNSSMNSNIGISNTTTSSSIVNATSSGTEATSSSSSKKGNIFTKAIKSVGGFIGKLFGKGSGIYGGASGMPVTDSFISQMDSDSNYGDSSYAEEGCAPATAAMLINKVNGNSMTMEDAGKYAVSHGYKVKGDGTKEGFFNDIFKSKGIDSENVRDSKRVLENLKAGKPTIILGQDQENKSKKNSPFGKNPHYVLATGLDNNGNIVVDDPEAKRGGKRYSPNILNKMKSAISTKTAGGRSGFGRFGGGTLDSMHIGNNGINLIKSCESLSKTAYKLKGETHYTIGYGHYGADVKPNQTITEEGAKALLAKDLVQFENYVKSYIKKNSPDFMPTQNQFDALVSYCYNRGPGGMQQLSEHSKTAQEYSKNIVIYWGSAQRYKDGLIKRRKKEQELFNSTAENFVPSGDYSSDTTTATSTESDYSQSSSTSSGIGSIFDNAFDNALNSIYGSSVMSFLKSAGLFSGGNVEDQTNVEASSDDSVTTSSTATTTTADGAVISSSATLGADVAKDAANYVGGRYVWGGATLGKGVDCSGFVQQLYKKHGYDGLIHQAKGQFKDDKHGTTIKGGTYKDLKPGDAMYFSSNGTANGIHHVGIYTGNGHMIHAQSSKTGIVDTDLSKSASYQKEYIGAKRFGSGSGLSGAAGHEIIGNAMKSKPSRINDTITTSQILTDTFNKSSEVKAINAKPTRPVKQQASVATDLINRLSASADGSNNLDTLIKSVEKIVQLLQVLADNTEPIAQICKLITGFSDDAKEAKKKSEESNKTTRRSMSVQSSNAKPGYQSSNSADILQLLTAFAQV